MTNNIPSNQSAQVSWLEGVIREKSAEIERLRAALQGFIDFQVTDYYRQADAATRYCTLRKDARKLLSGDSSAPETSEITRLKAALMRYGEHDSACPGNADLQNPSKCRCGLSEAIGSPTQETKPESHYCIDCNEAHDPKTCGALKESHHSQQLTSSSTSVGNDVKAEPHRHTDDCWEPDSGCDMGRNEKFAEKASAEHHPFPLTITPIPKKTIARCRCGAHDWPTGIVQIEDSCGRLHTLRGCQSEVVQKAGEEP